MKGEASGTVRLWAWVLFFVLFAFTARVWAKEEAVVPSSDPEQLTVAGNMLYFIADDGIHGRDEEVHGGT